MCPHWLYERLPVCYLLTAVGMITLTQTPLLWLAGSLLFVAGAVIWMMRSSYRRTDLIIFPTKRWFKPEWLYEAQPFIWLALGLLLSRLPNAAALLAVIPCVWACRCLWARSHYRHHASGLVLHLRRDPARRRRVRLLR
ncbi:MULTISPECIES: hypothetical protein [Aeromonas]|jgi:hypothetical protein|uniref:hypothetical protein n=1 Tax=Aeromonas TaxID=642 RepID=UPI000D353A64|nr:hypothetical protein [Aeromonas sp. HMWF014]PTT52292.1 hypothetical protein DBR19_09485 [Aeromonas sp. HMWF014]